MTERKRNQSLVPMELKLEALRRLENGESLNQIASELNVGRSTMFDWKRKKSKMELWCSQQNGADFKRMRKRMKASAYEKVNEALYQWYLMQKGQGVHVTGPALQLKALKLYEELKGEGESGFTASNGWLDKWKQRYGLVKPSDFEKFIVEPIIFLQEGATSENVEEKLKQQSLRNIELSYPPVDNKHLTEDSIPIEFEPTASTSKSATVTSQPKAIIKKSTTAKTSEKQKIAVPTETQFAITNKPTNDETAKLQEKIKQLEERNIQLQIENESYRIKNVMLETQKKKLIEQLKTIIKKKDPLDLGESTLVYEQHSERLTVGPTNIPVVPISSVSNNGFSTTTVSGEPRIAGSSATHSVDFSDAEDPGEDTAFPDTLDASEIEIDVDSEFETVDIKPNIVLEELPPPPPSPPPKRKRNIDTSPDQLDTSNNTATTVKRSKSDQALKKKQLFCDFGDDGDDDDDDDFQPDSGDDFDSEEDSAKVRRAYELLKSVFDKKDKYDIFCDRLAGRIRALKSPKVCRHVQQMLVTVVEDAEAGKYDYV